jgi:hypothetical protein
MLTTKSVSSALLVPVVDVPDEGSSAPMLASEVGITISTYVRPAFPEDGVCVIVVMAEYGVDFGTTCSVYVSTSAGMVVKDRVYPRKAVVVITSTISVTRFGAGAGAGAGAADTQRMWRAAGSSRRDFMATQIQNWKG